MNLQVPPTPDRRYKRGWIITAAVGAVVGLAAVLPSPYVLERPGPVVNALGEIRLETGDVPVINISEVETFESTGAVQVLSVSLQGSPENPLSWLRALPGLLDPTQVLLPVKDVFPENVNSADREAYNAALMDSSQVQAAVAALDLLGQPVAPQLVVASVSESGAAHSLLAPDDVILTVAGQPVAAVPEIRELLAGYPAGAVVPIQLMRAGELLEVEVVPQRDAETDQPLLGIEAATNVEFPFEIEVELDRIGGPSAGLTFAIAMYELLSPEDVLGGLNVSTTGTMQNDGTVGAIGGLPQKMWGAARADSDLMLFPMANCADVPAKTPSGLTLVPVSTLEESVEVIRAVRDGEPVQGLERCDLSTP